MNSYYSSILRQFWGIPYSACELNMFLNRISLLWHFCFPDKKKSVRLNLKKKLDFKCSWKLFSNEAEPREVKTIAHMILITVLFAFLCHRNRAKIDTYTCSEEKNKQTHRRAIMIWGVPISERCDIIISMNKESTSLLMTGFLQSRKTNTVETYTILNLEWIEIEPLYHHNLHYKMS